MCVSNVVHASNVRYSYPLSQCYCTILSDAYPNVQCFCNNPIQRASNVQCYCTIHSDAYPLSNAVAQSYPDAYPMFNVFAQSNSMHPMSNVIVQSIACNVIAQYRLSNVIAHNQSYPMLLHSPIRCSIVIAQSNRCPMLMQFQCYFHNPIVQCVAQSNQMSIVIAQSNSARNPKLFVAPLFSYLCI
ncbi:hypothetical protein CEXT_815331 [Caerostris extrusa]|uniref:Uncharacterized protein n=1 Tax=Caerostris extrusa TaxID=172846 RepID=A0AAV4PRV8_CAEEX|nr:hypothetical protein CEXT_815331 [Caerostris extrusa]